MNLGGLNSNICQPFFLTKMLKLSNGNQILNTKWCIIWYVIQDYIILILEIHHLCLIRGKSERKEKVGESGEEKKKCLVEEKSEGKEKVDGKKLRWSPQKISSAELERKQIGQDWWF